jgi:hypothetical protein
MLSYGCFIPGGVVVLKKEAHTYKKQNNKLINDLKNKQTNKPMTKS